MHRKPAPAPAPVPGPYSARARLSRLVESLRRIGRRRGILESCFGPLELRVLEDLWRRGGEASVRRLTGRFPGVAYTTLMTTLDRLHKKGVLVRRPEGRAYLYRPRSTRDDLEQELAADAFDLLLAAASGGAEPLLSSFVSAVERRDQLLLGELERLVRARRAAGGSRRPDRSGDEEVR